MFITGEAGNLKKRKLHDYESGRQKKHTPTGLREQVLLSALEFTGGDLRKPFTAEDLLMRAWERDPVAWGLRGYERQHPDSEKIRVEIDRANVKGGMVGLGLFEKIRQRTYRLTPSGLLAASKVKEADPSSRAMAERALADAIKDIISHPVFLSWTKDSATPKYFRDAGHFWGIAPGTPPSVISARIRDTDQTLAKAAALLDERRTDEVAERHGKVLYDRTDIKRAQEFHATLKQRFANDLSTLKAVVI
jgi:hypothetical protein